MISEKLFSIRFEVHPLGVIISWKIFFLPDNHTALYLSLKLCIMLSGTWCALLSPYARLHWDSQWCYFDCRVERGEKKLFTCYKCRTEMCICIVLPHSRVFSSCKWCVHFQVERFSASEIVVAGLRSVGFEWDWQASTFAYRCSTECQSESHRQYTCWNEHALQLSVPWCLPATAIWWCELWSRHNPAAAEMRGNDMLLAFL